MTPTTHPPEPPPEPAGMRRGVALAPLTSLGVGGPARCLLEASSAESCVTALRWADRQGLPVFVLGGGTNVVMSDEGFPGLVLRIDVRGVEVSREGEDALVTVGAGEEWDGFVERAVRQGWAGLECLSGIPGRVGATPIQNVGAYGQEVAETLVAVEAVDRETLETVRIPAGDCDFAYRSSRFKREPDRFVVVRVVFRLTPGGRPALRYEGLREAAGAEPDLTAVRDAVLAIRRAKGMVLDPGDPDTRSDGSFFLNPVLSARELERLERRLPGEEVPRYPSSEGFKVPAAWLIERAGFRKGDRWKGAGISTKHALALVNVDRATASEIQELAAAIRDRVQGSLGVTLEPEPRFVGLEPPA